MALDLEVLVDPDTTLGLCPVGSCTGLAVNGEPCDDCVALFAEQPGGWRLDQVRGPAPAPAPVDEAAAARETAALRARAVADGREKKPNQLCWLCEERRSCTKRPQGWECDTCLAVT